ncbi:hypothetical protein [Methylocystis bryophila]|uniref:Helix-turn-helix domain-containing protein n=1 Tax=Methylocystis bryophila TaxID=655015 RepID=A0A1W6MWF8_9HYPH|nr:hypothetical protein [Methylocystis bryophila]ARN81829.1 hypothetical protein B1812_12900 [Methylocystis bryophila]BDV37901.1 hypothetical protein DSM21852_11540 [Methylocystis bryophila]
MLQKAAPIFPTPFRRGGRLLFARSQVEAYKARVLEIAHGASAPPREIAPVETFVSAEEVARELGMARRTIGRLVAGREIPEVNLHGDAEKGGSA